MSSDKQITINKLNERINELINTNEELDNFKRMALRDIKLLKQQLNETLDLLEECNSSRSSRHIIKRIEAIETNLNFLKSQLNLIDTEHNNNLSEIKQIDNNIVTNTPASVINNIPAMPIINTQIPAIQTQESNKLNKSNKSNKLKNNVLTSSPVSNNLPNIDTIIQVPITSQPIQQLPITLETTNLQPSNLQPTTDLIKKVSNKQVSNKQTYNKQTSNKQASNTQISNKKSDDDKDEDNDVIEINTTEKKYPCPKGEYLDKKVNKCKPIPTCPEGEFFKIKKGKCVSKTQNFNNPNQKK